MVDSIKEHGILIPAIIKENLTEREAYVYVIETNMLQRSFDDLFLSQKAAVLVERYEKVMCQGRRNDILEEIAMLNGVDVSETCGHRVHRFPYSVPWGDLQHSFRRPHEL